jgi:hypothetical protein
VLACGACEIKLSLTDDIVVRRAELIAFCAAHNGHNDQRKYAVTVPRQGLCAPVASTPHAVNADTDESSRP